jgi:hypothetical protein
MKHRAARAIFVAAGLAVALPAAALPAHPSCGGGDKHGDEKKEKNPSVSSADPQCGEDHGGDKKKKGDEKS